MGEAQAAKAAEEDSEMELRQRLDPMLKQWSEEYGQKKNIRALLAGLDQVMPLVWPDKPFTPASMADLLDDAKVKKAYQKAVLKVHPDKVRRLPHENRFVAKRAFDA